MDHYRIIAENFQDTIEAISLSVDTLADGIQRGSQLMVDALLADRKIITCGNGVDAALAQLLTCHLLDRFEADRPALPAMTLGTDAPSLTAIVQSGGVENMFARQLHALAQPGDVLVCFNTENPADSLLQVLQTARDRNLGTILLSHTGSALPQEHLDNLEVHIQVDPSRPARRIELHTMVIHCICELVDHNLFGTSIQE